MIDKLSVNRKVDSLYRLDAFQGKSLSLNDSLSLSYIQDGLIENCFILGIEGMKNPTSAPFKTFLKYYEKIDSGQMINEQCLLMEEQDTLYHIIHSSDLVDAEKLFLEFSIGLSRFVLAVQIISKFVDYLSDTGKIISKDKIKFNNVLYSQNPLIKTCFFERISSISAVAVNLINTISLRYVSSQATYWSEVDHFFKIFKPLDELAKVLASIQHIPNNVRFLSVMQTMHWRGFGGSGEIFMDHTELKDLVVHAFSHHADYKITQSFNKRMVVFKVPLDAMLCGAQDLAVAFLTQQFPDGVLNVYDFCSGPHYTAVKGVFEKMPHRKFNLTVSDVDGRGLELLIRQKEDNITSKNVMITDVCYEDLMLPLKYNENNIEKYHFVSVNLGLHQLSFEKIYAALRHFTTITKHGGLISNLDASEQRYEQVMIIPGNLVDREGHVPYIETMDLTKLVVSNKEDEYVTFAYPMVRLAHKVIGEVERSVGVGPYMVSFYTPVRIKLGDFNKLTKLWDEGFYDACDQLINHYVLNFKILQSFLLAK